MRRALPRFGPILGLPRALPRFGPFARSSSILLLAGCLAFGVASCGSSTPPGAAPSAWAATFCGALESWTQQVGTVTTSYSSQMTNNPDATTVKNDTTAFLEHQAELIDTLIATVAKTGHPAVTNGAKVTQALLTAFNGYKNVVTQSQAQLTTISPSNTTVLYNALDSIGTKLDAADATLGKAVAAVGRKYSTAADQALVSALNSNKTCRKFATGS